MTHETQSIRTLDGDETWLMTRHAAIRANARGFTPADLEAVLTFGRAVHTRGAVIYALGRKEVARLARRGRDLAHLEGLQVVCDPDGIVLTAYRNHDFSSLKPGRHWARSRRTAAGSPRHASRRAA